MNYYASSFFGNLVNKTEILLMKELIQVYTFRTVWYNENEDKTKTGERWGAAMNTALTIQEKLKICEWSVALSRNI
jgi:hypothetical protein